MTKIDRRRLLSGAAAGLSLLTISAARAAEPKEVALWPGLPPGGEAVKVEQVVQESTNPMGRVSRVYSHVIKPTLTLYAPASGQATDAILVIPGGGFNSVWVEKEGHEIARWLAENGIAAGVLLYRLPTEPWASGTDVVLQDAQRGMRILRAQSGAKRLGVLGFSAGGTIAAALDARWADAVYPAVDALDKTSAKPDFCGYGYGFFNIPEKPAPIAFRGFSKTPATAFIFHAADDKNVNSENALSAFRAMKEAGVPAALYMFDTGGHGFALRPPAGAAAAAWPKLFLDWLKALPAA